MKSTPEFKQRYLNELTYLTNEHDHYQMTNEEYQGLIFDKFDQVFASFENFNDQQILALHNIHDTMVAIDTVLTPIRDAGIPYTLASTGGALYDFLTGKQEQTKDIDIILHFNIIPDSSEKPSDDTFCSPVSEDWTDPEPDPKNIISNKYQDAVHKLINQYAPQLAHANHKYDMTIFSHLVQRMIHKTYNTSKIYTEKNFKEGDYVKMLLHSLIKVSDSKLNKPVDIMLSQHSVQVYCDSFDFNICKNFIIYRKGGQKITYDNDLITDIGNQGFSPQLMLDHIICFPSALNDFVNKKYTMKLNSLRLADAEYYMNKHYPRIKEKLPEYELNFDCQPQHEHIAKAYIAQHRYEKLQEKVPHKEQLIAHKKKI